MGRTKELVTDGLLAAILIVFQAALSQLMNVELVTLTVILYALILGKRVIPIITIFIIAEGFLYGFGVWWISYLYIWPLLAGVTWLLKKFSAPDWGYAVLSGLFGLLFGFMCSLPYMAGGFGAVFSWWISGIPYDILHGVSNLVIALFLFKPMRKLLNMCLSMDFLEKD